MEKNCPDKVEGERQKINEYFKAHLVSIEEIEIKGKKLKYWVLDKETEPALSGFVSMAGGQLAISEEVKVEYRYFYLLHEYLEFVEYAGIPGRCEEALKCELAEVPDEIRVDYVKYRLDFFRRLVEYSTKRDADAEFIAEIEGSTKLLELLHQCPL